MNPAAVQPRVSVVMPVYNAEAYVEMAIRSVLESDLQQLEIIAADDGSSDRSAAIVAAIPDPRIVPLQLARSGGPSRPRNAGIEHARAPYVAFLDADDLVKSHKLGSAVAALERNARAGFAFADFESVDEEGRLIQRSVLEGYPVFRSLGSAPAGDGWCLIEPAELTRGLLHENFIGTSGVVVRKDALGAVGEFDESLGYSEDRDLWFRLAHRFPALYCQRVGHGYRVRRGSLSSGSGIRNAHDRIRVLRREKERWHDRAARQQLDRAIAENLAGIGYAERQSRRLHALAMYARAFVTSPDTRWLRGLVGSLLR